MGQFPSENILYVALERLSFVSNLAELGRALVNPDMVVRSSGRDCIPIC
jgi:hypothetical protein